MISSARRGRRGLVATRARTTRRASSSQQDMLQTIVGGQGARSLGDGDMTAANQTPEMKAAYAGSTTTTNDGLARRRATNR